MDAQITARKTIKWVFVHDFWPFQQLIIRRKRIEIIMSPQCTCWHNNSQLFCFQCLTDWRNYFSLFSHPVNMSINYMVVGRYRHIIISATISTSSTAKGWLNLFQLKLLFLVLVTYSSYNHATSPHGGGE